jgi:hypothetical protein
VRDEDGPGDIPGKGGGGTTSFSLKMQGSWSDRGADDVKHAFPSVSAHHSTFLTSCRSLAARVAYLLWIYPYGEIPSPKAPNQEFSLTAGCRVHLRHGESSKRVAGGRVDEASLPRHSMTAAGIEEYG